MSKGLGKQFGSLMPDHFDEDILLDKKDRVKILSLDELIVNPNQPRQDFDKDTLKELSVSIKRYGILQPLIVTPDGDKYMIIAGERRYRAANLAGLDTVPTLIRSSEELERLEIGLIENVQRVDLSPLEQAESIARLHEQFNITLSDIAKRLGKAENTIINTLRLLQLNENVKEALNKKQISEGHAKALLALKADDELTQKALDKVINGKLSVRQTESLVKQLTTEIKISNSKTKNIKYKEHLKPIEKIFGSKISIASKARGKGMITINFDNKKDLERIISLLKSVKKD